MMNLEQAQEIRNSANWTVVQKELDYRIACLYKSLSNCDQEELFTLQTKIKIYEEIKRLPDDVVDREQYPASD